MLVHLHGRIRQQKTSISPSEFARLLPQCLETFSPWVLVRLVARHNSWFSTTPFHFIVTFSFQLYSTHLSELFHFSLLSGIQSESLSGMVSSVAVCVASTNAASWSTSKGSKGTSMNLWGHNCVGFHQKASKGRKYTQTSVPFPPLTNTSLFPS